MLIQNQVVTKSPFRSTPSQSKNTGSMLWDMLRMDEWYEWRRKRLPVLNKYTCHKAGNGVEVKYEYTAVYKPFEITLPLFPLLPPVKRQFATFTPPKPTYWQQVWNRIQQRFYQKNIQTAVKIISILSIVNTAARLLVGGAAMSGLGFFLPLTALAVGVIYSIPALLIAKLEKARRTLEKRLDAAEKDINEGDKKNYLPLEKGVRCLEGITYFEKILLQRLPGNVDLKWRYHYLFGLYGSRHGYIHTPQDDYRKAYPYCTTEEQKFLTLKLWIESIYDEREADEREYGKDLGRNKNDLEFCLAQLPEKPFQKNYEKYKEKVLEVSKYFLQGDIPRAVELLEKIKYANLTGADKNYQYFDFCEHPNIGILLSQLDAILCFCTQLHPKVGKNYAVEERFINTYSMFVCISYLMSQSYPDIVEEYRESGRTFMRTAKKMRMLLEEVPVYDWNKEAMTNKEEEEKADERSRKRWHAVLTGNYAKAGPSTQEEEEVAAAPKRKSTVIIEEIAEDELQSSQSTSSVRVEEIDEKEVQPLRLMP